MFLFFKLWIPTKFEEKPLPIVTERLQVFFWIKRKVYQTLLFDRKMKDVLKMKTNPERRTPLSGNYLVKHGQIKDDKGKIIDATQYKGSGIIYKRHSVNSGTMKKDKAERKAEKKLKLKAVEND